MFPDSNPTIVVLQNRCVTRQLRQLHSSFCRPHPFIAPLATGRRLLVLRLKGRPQAMDVLRTDHSAVNGIEIGMTADSE
ncbi:hypothetical protein TNCV_874161 [Trichonephila clavipes]|nr:hypothetical protein TNCV_874161 [Trichonephila clavipes]